MPVGGPTGLLGAASQSDVGTFARNVLTGRNPRSSTHHGTAPGLRGLVTAFSAADLSVPPRGAHASRVPFPASRGKPFSRLETSTLSPAASTCSCARQGVGRSHVPTPQTHSPTTAQLLDCGVLMTMHVDSVTNK